MGKKAPIVSFLCGVFTGRKKSTSFSTIEDAKKRQDNSDSSTSSGGGFAASSPEFVTKNRMSDGVQSPVQWQPLPPPPGARHHMRTVSCQDNRSYSGGGVSKLVSSASLRVTGGGESRHKEKKFTHEDSIWKKTIILGERCRVPDESVEDILYDENGNKFFTYHPKGHSGLLTFSSQSSSTDQDELSKN